MKITGNSVLLVLGVWLMAFAPWQTTGFEAAQKKYPRVQDAYERKEELVFMRCRSKEVSEDFSNMFIRVFKQEAQMEVWVQDIYGKYILFNQYNVYAMSGELGPKRMRGDAQVPEGFYYINDFNPVSNYHLSLGINYPNKSDMILSKAEDKGGDIYIHGARVSAGCIAMSNYYIEDIYIYSVKAHNHGQQNIPVQIFPFRMTETNMKKYMAIPMLKQYTQFWNNLQQGYKYFETYHKPAMVSIDDKGLYQFNNTATAVTTK